MTQGLPLGPRSPTWWDDMAARDLVDANGDFLADTEARCAPQQPRYVLHGAIGKAATRARRFRPSRQAERPTDDGDGRDRTAAPFAPASCPFAHAPASCPFAHIERLGDEAQTHRRVPSRCGHAQRRSSPDAPRSDRWDHSGCGLGFPGHGVRATVIAPLSNGSASQRLALGGTLAVLVGGVCVLGVCYVAGSW
jgi:hypothetical protein